MVNPDVQWPESYNLAYKNNAVAVYDAAGQLIEEVAWSEIPHDYGWSKRVKNIGEYFIRFSLVTGAILTGLVLLLFKQSGILYFYFSLLLPLFYCPSLKKGRLEQIKKI